MSNLHIMEPKQAELAWKNLKEVGLFHLFFKEQYLQVITYWTNIQLTKETNTKISVMKMHAFFGLQLAMSVCKFCRINNYWSKQMFLGHADFKSVMSRDDFKKICAKIVFC